MLLSYLILMKKGAATPIIEVSFRSPLAFNQFVNPRFIHFFIHPVAHAPRNVYRKIPTLAELETEAKTTAATNDEDLPGLQLRVLTSTLVPGTMLVEKDEEWNFDSLLREITNELSDVPKPAPRKKENVKESSKEKEKSKKNK